jgi:hypothetical protein
MTRDMTLGRKVLQWRLLLQLVVRGEIPELTDIFKKTTVTEDDRRAYHDR